MAAIKDTLLDKDENEIYPKTVTDNVFDSEGNRLDNVIGSIKENLVKVDTFVITLTAGSEAHGAWYYNSVSIENQLSKYEKILSYTADIIEPGTGINMPQNAGIREQYKLVYYQSGFPNLTASIRVTVLYTGLKSN